MIKRSLLTLALITSGAAVIAAPAPVTDVNGASLETRVEALERIVNSRTEAQHRIQAQLDTMQNEVNELRGTLETHTYQLEQILERQRELYREIDKRIEEVTAMQAKPTTQNVSVMQPVTPTPVTSNPAVAMKDSQAYDNAVSLILKEKKYDDAIPAFEAFIQNYPGSSYEANAYYWLGQLLFNKNEFDASKDKFSRLVNNFVDSSKRAESMLKLGMIAQAQNDNATAKQYFERVIAEYSQSSSARLAESRLKSLK